MEGAAELDETAFASDGLSVSLVRTADGKAKATVTPVGAPPTFFLRVKAEGTVPVLCFCRVCASIS